MAVALVGAFRGTLMQRGADGVGELGLDQRLVDRFRGGADTVADIGGLECVGDFEQGRQTHAVAPPTRSGTPNGPRTYTTSGDVTHAGAVC